MMKLSTMGMLVATLNEHGESLIANTIAARWQHDAGTVRFFRASANFLFVFESAGKQYVLRFIDAAERAPEVIRAELDYINHLAARGVWVAAPVASIGGNLVETVATVQGTFHAVAFERLVGKQLELEELTSGQIIRWGQTLGELHTAAEGYEDTGRPTWQDQLAFVAAGLPEQETAAATALHRVRDELARLPIQTGNFGLIHFDFEPDNIIWQDNRVGVFDFDDCAREWFAADIAFALRDAFGDRSDTVDMQNPTVQQFIQGYRVARGIDDRELAQIPLFLELHNLIMFVKLFHSLAPDDSRVEIEWLAELRKKLRRKIEFYREGFVRSVEKGIGD